MAQQDLDLGASPNDGTGTNLRAGGDIINDNFTEIYGTFGWGVYADAATTPATQVFTTTPALLQIDGAGSTSNSAHLPREIRGSAELWDTTNDLITPINSGDGYDIRVSLGATAKTGSPNEIIVQLDIGGGGSPTIVVAEVASPASKTTPFTATISIPIFTLSTFLSNGGQIFVSTDAGTITIGTRSILIKRDYNGDS